MQAMDLFAGARMALLHYELVESDLHFIGHNENVTFQVLDGRGGAKYLLRLHKPITENFVSARYAPVALASEMLWLEALYNESPLVVQQPIRNRQGEFVAMIQLDGEAIPCTLLRWIEGEAFSQCAPAAPELMEKLGGVLACLHEHTISWQIPSGFVRPIYDAGFFRAQAAMFLPAVRQGIVTAQDYASIQEMVEVVTALLATIPRDNESWGLIHADLHRDNVLVHEGQVFPIDFSLCGFGYRLFDFGSSLPSFKGELRQACIDGYLRYRLLPADSRRLIEAFCLLSRMCSYVFVLPLASEYERLKQRIAHFVANECQQFLRHEPILLTM